MKRTSDSNELQQATRGNSALTTWQSTKHSTAREIDKSEGETNVRDSGNMDLAANKYKYL